MTQRMQAIVQNNLISMALAQGNRPLRVPLLVRLITAVPWFQGITARFVGLGVRPEHVRSPVGHSPASMSFRWQQSLRGWPSAPRLPDQHQTKR
jgi:hypothetical protein